MLFASAFSLSPVNWSIWGNVFSQTVNAESSVRSSTLMIDGTVYNRQLPRSQCQGVVGAPQRCLASRFSASSTRTSRNILVPVHHKKKKLQVDAFRGVSRPRGSAEVTAKWHFDWPERSLNNLENGLSCPWASWLVGKIVATGSLVKLLYLGSNKGARGGHELQRSAVHIRTTSGPPSFASVRASYRYLYIGVDGVHFFNGIQNTECHL